MGFILTCHHCTTKLRLFDSAIKKRKGYIRCTRCGSRIFYDLDAPRIQRSGFYEESQSSFDIRTKEKILMRLSHDISSEKKIENRSIHSDYTPFQQKTGFASFDIHTGTIKNNSFDTPSAPVMKQPVPSIPRRQSKNRILHFNSIPTVIMKQNIPLNTNTTWHSRLTSQLKQFFMRYQKYLRI